MNASHQAPRSHTDREFEAELRQLRDQLLLLGGRVEGSIEGGIRALLQRDTPLAQRVIEADVAINRQEVEIDELCLSILARRQPVASDLRFVSTALKLVTDLERMGDLGANIAKRVIELNAEPPLRPYLDLEHMGAIVRQMVRDALDAFVDSDVSRAERVIARDADVDAYNTQIFRELLTYMMEDPRNVARAIKILNVAKTLERVGDHATNLAEMVVFMVRGQDIRHASKR
jgi:phosphate transport system protein